MKSIELPTDFILVCWAHPSSIREDSIDHYNSLIYSEDEMDKAERMYESAVRFNNTPAFIYYNGEFIKHSKHEQTAENTTT